jgi:flagellar motility protein MotE (MotC chaperone)
MGGITVDDDVVQLFHAVNERFKKLEAALRDEKDEREGLGGRLETTDGEVTAINKSMGVWVRGGLSGKLDDLEKAIDDTKKRMDALEKRLKK